MAVLAILCGCVSYTPQPIAPELALERLGYRAVGVQHFGNKAVGSSEWIPLAAEIDLRDGLDLAEANTLALFYGPEIRAARSRARVSASLLLQAGLLANPQVMVGPKFSVDSDDSLFPADLLWELPLWGEPAAEKEQAQGRLEGARARLLVTEFRVLAQVRELFIEIASLRRTQEALEAQLQASERVLEWVVALQKVGDVDAVTAYLARLEEHEARAELSESRLELRARKRRLLESIGLLPRPDVFIALEPDPTLLPALPEVRRERLLLHPRIASAVADYEAAEATFKLEIARQYPSLRIGPSYEDDRGDAFVGVGAQLTLPVFDRNRGNVLAAEERREAARGRLDSALLKITHDEALARAEWTETRRLLDDFHGGALDGFEEARRTLELRLRAGQSNVLEVLAALRAITRVRVHELELERDAAMAHVRAAVAGGAVLQFPADETQQKDAP